MADDSEFSLAADGEGKPSIYWKGDLLGSLSKGRSLLQPVFAPVKAVAGLEGDALRDIVTRAEAWIESQLAKAMGGIMGLLDLSQQADVDGNVRALAVRLADEGGIAGRHFLSDAIAALPKEARGAARKGGIVFGALDIYHHAALKPAAAKWRAALFAARDARPMPVLPPESAVHLKEWKFASPAEARNAGYRRIGDEYVRIDLAERVIKKAHEARGQGNSLSMDMAFATSLGISDDGLKALMRDAGFRPAEAKPKTDDVAVEADTVVTGASEAVPEVPALVEAVEVAESADVIASPQPLEPADPVSVETAADEVAPAVAEQPSNLTHWRWVGLPKPRPQEQRQQRPRPDRHKPAGNMNAKRREERPAPAPKPAAQPSALALQLAALKGLKF
jgi:ATP-dependent RNA helicase SUPV3L1/SUV3